MDGENSRQYDVGLLHGKSARRDIYRIRRRAVLPVARTQLCDIYVLWRPVGITELRLSDPSIGHNRAPIGLTVP